jgi:hypothetical protein
MQQQDVESILQMWYMKRLRKYTRIWELEPRPTLIAFRLCQRLYTVLVLRLKDTSDVYLALRYTIDRIQLLLQFHGVGRRGMLSLLLGLSTLMLLVELIRQALGAASSMP